MHETKMKLNIIMPAASLPEVEAELVTMVGADGVFGVMPGHAKLTANIMKDIVKVQTSSGYKRYYIHGGVAQVTGDELNILTEFAEDLSVAKKGEVKEILAELQEELKELKDEDLEKNIILEKIDKYQALLDSL